MWSTKCYNFSFLLAAFEMLQFNDEFGVFANVCMAIRTLDKPPPKLSITERKCGSPRPPLARAVRQGPKLSAAANPFQAAAQAREAANQVVPPVI
jgi:hypothetical protein